MTTPPTTDVWFPAVPASGGVLIRLSAQALDKMQRHNFPEGRFSQEGPRIISRARNGANRAPAAWLNPYIKVKFSELKGWSGDSYGLALVVADILACLKTPTTAPIYATGIIGEDGAINAVGEKSLAQKLLLLTDIPPNSRFFYPAVDHGESVSVALQALQNRGIQTHSVRHVDEVLELLTSRESATADPDTPRQTSGDVYNVFINNGLYRVDAAKPIQNDSTPTQTAISDNVSISAPSKPPLNLPLSKGETSDCQAFHPPPYSREKAEEGVFVTQAAHLQISGLPNITRLHLASAQQPITLGRAVPEGGPLLPLDCPPNGLSREHLRISHHQGQWLINDPRPVDVSTLLTQVAGVELLRQGPGIALTDGDPLAILQQRLQFNIRLDQHWLCFDIGSTRYLLINGPVTLGNRCLPFPELSTPSAQLDHQQGGFILTSNDQRQGLAPGTTWRLGSIRLHWPA